MEKPPSYTSPTVYPNTAVITTQPTVIQQTTVVLKKPTDWDSGICGCCEDMKSCACACCLGNFYYATLARRMNESCCVGCCGYPNGIIPGGHMVMRSAFRNKHGIKGDICGDCFMIAFCLPCAMCQLSRQMDSYGYDVGSC